MRNLWSTVVTLSLCSLLTPLLAAAPIDKGPLAEYLQKPDSSYGWRVRHRGELGKSKFVELTLTSQIWKGHTWRHQLFVIRPSTMQADESQALLFIGGGDWQDSLAAPNRSVRLPSEASLMAGLAERLRTPVAVLLQVPKQPMFNGRREDEIIALTFARFLESGDVEWPLLLPMVKSAVRAMDAVQEMTRQSWDVDIRHFTVTGASKRGWTTWLTGASDKRVNAIAPIVIDMLNLDEHLKHQRKTWGKLSYKIDDYSRLGLDKELSTPPGQALQRIVDPFHYRQALDKTKLIIIGTNDHYWPLDSLNLYWQDLTGPKHILYVPNNRHGLRDLDRLAGSLSALHQQARGAAELPEMKWSFENGRQGLQLRIESDRRPRIVRAWSARANTRDFRRATWTSAACQEMDGVYHYQLAAPANGCAACFGEAVFGNEDGTACYFSTNVRVLTSR